MRKGGVRKDRVFKVCITVPDGATEDQVMDYIEDAVTSFKGGLPPEDPMFNLDPDTVSVKRVSPKYGEHETNA